MPETPALPQMSETAFLQMSETACSKCPCRGLIEANYFGPTTADTLEMLSLLTMVLECTGDLILRFCALPDVLPPYLCSHRCESLTPCHRQLSLSFAPSGFIVLDVDCSVLVCVYKAHFFPLYSAPAQEGHPGWNSVS